MRDGVLVTPPNGERSSVGIGPDGTLDVRRVEFFGTWQGLGQRRALNDLNQLPGTNGISLFTPSYGPLDAAESEGSFAVVLAPFPPAAPNTDLVAPVVAIAQGARHAASRRAAPCSSRAGTLPRSSQAEAAVGTPLALRLDPPARLDGDRRRRRRRARARAGRQARLPRERSVHVQPARAAAPAHRRSASSPTGA